MIGVYRGKRRGVFWQLRLSEDVEQDVLTDHVRIHLPHIGPLMFVVPINQSVYVHELGSFGPFMCVVLINGSIYVRGNT
jgi:hypothetical protein